MDKREDRKPIGNFFLKKNLQIRLIKKIVFAVFISTIVCVATLLLTYWFNYKSAVFYQVSFDAGSSSIGDRLNIISIILPSVIISIIVNVFIAIGIGLYASRKYAVPIFKLEQWAELLLDGCLTVRLNFREKAEMKELCDECNKLTDSFRKKFIQIKDNVEQLEKNNKDSEHIININKVLKSMVLDSETVELKTTYSNPAANESGSNKKS